MRRSDIRQKTQEPRSRNSAIFVRNAVNRALRIFYPKVSSLRVSCLIVFCLIFSGLLVSYLPIRSQSELSSDPYLWLEEVESEKALTWVKEKNAISDERIKGHALYAPLKQRYTEIYNDADKIAYPTIVGQYVYNLWQDEKHARGIWRRMPIEDYAKDSGQWETILDLDELSEKEGKKWVFDWAEWLQPGNEICLLALAEGGTDENEVREFNVKKKVFVKDGFYLPPSKGGVIWEDANTVLVYRDFGEGTLTTSGYPRQVRRWKRGQSMQDAELLYQVDETNVGAFCWGEYVDGKQYTFIYDSKTFHSSKVYKLDGNEMKQITYPEDAELQALHDGQIVMVLQSDWVYKGVTYKTGSIVGFDMEDNISGSFSVDILFEPNKRSSFSSISVSKDFVVLNIMENVQNGLMKFHFNDGRWKGHRMEAPDYGSIYLLTSGNHTNHFFFRYSNFINPTTLIHSDGIEMNTVKKLKGYFNTEGMVVNQYWATSADQTAIPYFIVHDNSIELDGKNPTMISAYGGFGVSRQPNYSATVGAGWLEQGGVYVLANIRGGGEFGPEWHQSGMKKNKQNSYNDVYAVAEDLIRRKITSSSHLGVFGWSNGGLMAGVLLTQRPDLFHAIVSGAPLLDMKRYSKLLAGASWIGEYGNPDIPEEWAYIKEYSPYHNVFKERSYPEVFFVTSTKDDRVHPGHARKMAAKMEAMGHPMLYHETIEGGHGAASTMDQRAEMWAKVYTYFNMKLNRRPVKR